MGPFDLDTQLKRVENINRLLEQDLPPQAREMWTHIRDSIAFTEDDYNMRVMWTYRNHNKDIVE